MPISWPLFLFFALGLALALALNLYLAWDYHLAACQLQAELRLDQIAGAQP